MIFETLLSGRLKSTLLTLECQTTTKHIKAVQIIDIRREKKYITKLEGKYHFFSGVIYNVATNTIDHTTIGPSLRFNFNAHWPFF